MKNIAFLFIFIALGVIIYKKEVCIMSDISIKVNKIPYACNDCIDSYLILKSEAKNILKKEIKVIIIDERLREKIEQETARCQICYQYKFSGNLKYSFEKGYVFYAHNATYKLKNNYCCQ